MALSSPHAWAIPSGERWMDCMSQVLSFKEIDPTPAASDPSLVFSNPGVLDINLVKLLGVSVKDSDNAIGFFGTGLKYALASTLRFGGEITIFSDGQRFDVGGELLTLRGKEFTRVAINGEPLGFTTELGKQWEPWMVVRELYSNALDEKGGTSVQVQDLDELQAKSARQTIIVLRGEPFLEVWNNRADYFIAPDETPIQVSEHADAYPHRCGGRSVFYRGIRVYDARKSTVFRYNLRGKTDLTEDRTARYLFQITEAIERSIITSRDASYIRKVLTCGDECFEGDLAFSDSSLQTLPMSDEFQAVCSELAERKPVKHNRRAVKFYQDRTHRLVPMTPVALSMMQQKQLAKATAFIRSLGFADRFDDYPVVVVGWLGEHVYGLAKGDRIYLTKQAFDLGTKKLAAIILEEYVHNHFQLHDETREMQSWLFERIVTMGEEHIMGEPL